jgi:hypothetical protein
MNDTTIQIHFPLSGIDRSQAFDRQPARKGMDGHYARTTIYGQNVRGYDPRSNRARGGARPGLARYVNERVNGVGLIQSLRYITGVGYDAPGGGVQSSSSGRLVTLVAVAGGTVKVADAGADTWTIPTNGTTALNTTGLIYSAPNAGKLWFADGTNWKYYDPEINSVETWAATAGTLPVDGDGNKPRLIETWRGCTVLSGLIGDPQNVFCSAVGNPRDFDYAPANPSATDAFAFNSAPFGKAGDVVTGLVPMNDDVLLIGMDHSLSILRGHPAMGGTLDIISDAIGMAWGRAWCRNPEGVLFFCSNRMGVYAMRPGGMPERISRPIEQLLESVNTGANTIHLAWSDRYQGFHLFVTPTAGAAAANHLFFEQRTGSWWLDHFENNQHNPLCSTVFDGNQPDDRVTLIGSFDGFVRHLDPDAEDDDGSAIESETWIGPLTTKDLDELMLYELQGALGDDSGDIQFAVHIGETAEEAFASEAVQTGTWTSGRNLNSIIRQAGYAIYLKLTSSNPWSFEACRARVSTLGKVRRRS